MIRPVTSVLAFLLPALPLAAQTTEGGFPQTYQCGSHAVTVGFGTDAAWARIGGTWRTLEPVPTGSGARYAVTGSPDHWVWNKGADMTVNLPETGETGCTTPPEAALAISGGGNEPGWRLTIADGKAELVTLADSANGGAVASVAPTAEGWQVEYGAGTALITPMLCRDTATGMPFPYRMTVMNGGSSLKGCAGAPVSLIADIAWTIVSVGSTPVPEDSKAMLLLDAHGRMSGDDGCNRMTAPYALSGEGLALGPIATTRMACPEAQMLLASSVQDALASVTRFDVSDNGELLLISGDAPVIVARP